MCILTLFLVNIPVRLVGGGIVLRVIMSIMGATTSSSQTMITSQTRVIV
jgi:hypothetical protein